MSSASIERAITAPHLFLTCIRAELLLLPSLHGLYETTVEPSASFSDAQTAQSADSVVTIHGYSAYYRHLFLGGCWNI